MSDKIQLQQTLQESHQIQAEPPKIDDFRVVKLDQDFKASVESFVPGKLKKKGDGEYESVKGKFGALAATDPDRVAKTKKDSRFAVNALARGPLSIEEEERRVIEEKVRARVQAVADDAKAKAADAGYQEGLKKGFDEAYQKFRQEGAGRLAKFDEFLASSEKAKEEIFRANERFLVELFFRISRMVLLKELTTDKEYVLRLARELIERVGVRENIRVKVHPEDLATCSNLKEGLESAFGQLKNLNIEPSAQTSRGGCVVETEWNAIDASIDAQFKGIHDALTGTRSAS